MQDYRVLLSSVVLCVSLLLSAVFPFSSAAIGQNFNREPGAVPEQAPPAVPLRDAPRLAQPPQNAETSQETPAAFDMSAVERLRLRILEYPDLSGEYSIESGSTLALPGIGRVDVRGLSPSELERELARRVSFFARRDLTVSVEIERFRPYYIVGLIGEPGAREWRPGLNVVKAIALARGTIRPPAPMDDPMASLTLQQSRTQLHFSLALLARLEAERDGAAAIETSSRMASLLRGMPPIIQPQIEEFITRQSAMLEEQRQLMRGQRDALERELEAARSELAAAEAQEAAFKSQMDISESLLNDVEQLKERKLVSNSRYLTQRSDLVTSQIRHAEARTLKERARSRAESVEAQIETLERQRKVALNERIEALQREVAQLEVGLLRANGGAASGMPADLTYHIARNVGGTMMNIAATVFTEILPDDVIVVSSGETSAPARPDPGASGSSQEHTDAAGRIQKAIEASSTAQTRNPRPAGAASGVPTN